LGFGLEARRNFSLDAQSVYKIARSERRSPLPLDAPPHFFPSLSRLDRDVKNHLFGQLPDVRVEVRLLDNWKLKGRLRIEVRQISFDSVKSLKIHQEASSRHRLASHVAFRAIVALGGRLVDAATVIRQVRIRWNAIGTQPPSSSMG
jgi:hypothetical protein